MSLDYATPIAELIPAGLLPEGLTDFLRRESGDLFDGVYFTDYVVAPRADGLSVLIDLVFAGELAFELPGLEGTALVIGGNGDGATTVTASVDVGSDGFEFRLDNITLALRFPPAILKPVAPSEGAPVPEHAQIQTHGSVVLDKHFNLSVEGFDSLDLPAAMIADSGVVIAASNVKLDLSRTATIPEVTAAGFDDDFMGIYLGSASVRLPEGLPELAPHDLVLTNAAIGTGGVSGKLAANYAPVYDEQTNEFSGPGSGSLFGIPFGLKSVSIELHQNAFVESTLAGVMILPFFDGPVEVDIALGLDGGFSVGLSSTDGLITLSKPGLLELELDSIGFALDGGVFTASVGGTITPLFGGMDWPGFQVTELSIDSKGHVRLEGGWLDLGSQYALDFHAFTLEITKIGFGKDPDGARWIGFSGALNLVEGLPAGASVDGLRVSWRDGEAPRVTLAGVSVHFEVPGVVKFLGEVSYREFTDETTGELVHRFDGDIMLAITAIGLEIDASLVIGTAGTTPADTYTFFAIYIGVELPVGIPLGTTGLGLFGLAGLFALNMEPNRHPPEPWYGVGPTDGWYHRGAPAITPGVTNLRTKWGQRRGSLALGAGVTIGTLSDNGYTFSAKVLLVLVLPGPIIMIEGKGNLLKERAKLNAEPTFRTLAVFDNRAGTLLIGIDAQFSYGDEGDLIGIQGGTEAYYEFADPMAWHIYVGEKDPVARRIRARLFKLFDANAYLMADAHQIAAGAWIGLDKHWDFGPLGVRLEAWLQADAVLSFKPPHFNAGIWMHADIGLSIFGFSAGLQADARLAADVFKPTHIIGDLSVKIDLPWPLPDAGAHLPLEWGPEKSPPPLPVPVKEVAVEHLKASLSWPLPRGSLLAPDYDADGDGFLDGPQPAPAVQAALPPPAAAPVVPLDARPHIAFTRPVNDDGAVGALNARPVVPEWERIGDPSVPAQGTADARYGLRSVALDRWDGAAWQPVARKAADPNPAGVASLYGTWAPVPPAPGGTGDGGNQTKLWLWSRTPFDFTRTTSGEWSAWLTAHYPDYPCIGPAPDRIGCVDFGALPAGAALSTPWPAGTVAGAIVLSWTAPQALPLDAAGALVVPPTSSIELDLPVPASRVDLTVFAAPLPDDTVCVDFRGLPAGTGPNPRVEGALSFLVLDPAGRPVGQTTIRAGRVDHGTLPGLDCGSAVQVSLPPSGEVEVTLSTQAQPAEVRALVGGKVVAAAKLDPAGPQPQTLVLRGDGITALEVRARSAESLLHEVCHRTGGQAAVSALARLAAGGTVGPVAATGGAIGLVGKDIVAVTLTGTGAPYGLVRGCANFGPEPGDRTRRQVLQDSVLTAVDTWPYTVGTVLAPHTAYRLAVTTTVQTRDFSWDAAWNTTREQTVYGYFRTEGPPGLAQLSTPAIDPAPAEFQSGLDDLTRYVRQTVPPTVPAAGAQPVLPRPVFRAYDVGVEFDEDYVDLMYRLAGADLGLYLFDANNRPVRDAAGRLLTPANQWGVTDSTTLNLAEQAWVTVVNESACVSITTADLPHQTTLGSAGTGQVLAADTLHEARLVPLLLHEAFGAGYTVGQSAAGPAGTLGRWSVADAVGAANGPSRWVVGAAGTPATRFVTQTSALRGAGADPSDPAAPGTALLTGAATWTDYRLSAYLRSTGDGAIGLLFRHVDADTWYRFSMHRGLGYRRLDRCAAGRTRTLAEDRYVYGSGSDYLVTVEAIGPDLAIYQDGAEVFRVSDSALPAGRIGLYCHDNADARFTDVRLDDLRADAPVAYRFSFTTSRYADFAHLVASHDDRTWVAAIDPDPAADPGVAADLAAAAEPAATSDDAAPGEAEHRAYEHLAGLALGAGAYQLPDRLEVTRLDRGAESLGLLVRSPEPLDWTRTALALAAAADITLAATPPGALKLTGYQPGQWLEVTARTAADLSGARVEVHRPAGPLPLPAGDPVLATAPFAGPARGQVYTERFGVAALDRYTIVDQGADHGPSAWTADGTAIRQTSGVFGGSTAPADAAKPGTVALLSGGSWPDLRVTASFGTPATGAVGLVFRYTGEDAYYRFSVDGSYRRLVKKVGQVVTTLWEDTEPPGGSVTVEAVGDHLVGLVDGTLAFSVRDGSLGSGTVGLYAWANPQAVYTGLAVETLERDPVRWEPVFGSLAELATHDLPGASGGPANWGATGGVLSQAAAVADPGTVAVGLDPYADLRLSAVVTLGSAGSAGLLWRYADDDNHYRLTLDVPTQRRWLTRRVAGVDTVLWQDTGHVPAGGAVPLTVTAVGSRLAAVAAGVPLFALTDGTLAAGRVGFHTSAEDAATFSGVLLADPSRQVGPYAVVDSGTPSVWRCGAGVLSQTATGGASMAVDPTPVGDARWRVRLRTAAPGALGVVFRYTDPANHYRLVLDSAQLTQSLVKLTAGTATTLWTRTAPSPVDSPVSLTLDLIADRLVGYLEESLLFDVHDTDHPGGGTGFYAAGNPTAQFLAAELSALPLEARALFHADSASAGAIGEPGWTDVVLSARLTGTATGVLFRYTDAANHYRFGTDQGVRRLTRTVAGTATVLWEGQGGPITDLVISAVGSTLRAYAEDVPLLSVTDTAHPAGQVMLDGTATAVGVWARLAPAALLHDDFDVLRTAVWAVSDQGGGPSSWSATGGELRQTSASAGTRAAAGDPTWTDYRVTVQLASDTAAPVGVEFRYTDAEHTYRFAADPSGPYRRLTRHAGGSTETLWQDTEPLPLGRAHVLTVDCLGDQLTGYLNGVPVFEVYDSALPAGAIALFCAANPGARFQEVRVSPALWTTYHRFPADSPRPAGTRIRIPETAPLRPGTEARVIDAAGAPSGGRRLFAATRYTAEPVRVLRNADSTACILVPAAGPLPTAIRRLTLTYHRDITATDPDSVVLRQNGDATPESATLDIP